MELGFLVTLTVCFYAGYNGGPSKNTTNVSIMSRPIFKQCSETILSAHKVLIALPAHPDHDAIISAIGCAQILESLGKKWDIVCSEFSTPPTLGFLPHLHKISTQVPAARKFTISLDLKEKTLDEFSYEVENNLLKIYVTPKQGSFVETDLHATPGSYTYDVLLTINVRDYKQLGKIFDEHSEFFLKIPTINIDSLAENEHFGSINLVEITASCTSELLFELFSSEFDELISENVSTTLLSGIIASTNSFKAPNVTPQTLHVVSELLKRGAQRDQIITNLYKKNTLASLKLWGKALQKLLYDPDNKIAWSVLGNDDFLETKAKPEHVAFIVDELTNNAPNTKVILLAVESVHSYIDIHIRTAHSVNALDLCKHFNPSGNARKALVTLKNTPLEEATAKVLAEVKRNLRG